MDECEPLADGLCKLERELFGRWMQWLTSSWGDGSGRSGFSGVLDVVDKQLAAAPGGGPYFMGPDLSLVDITFTPFLERMASSLAYYKGVKIEGNGGRWPAVDNWQGLTLVHFSAQLERFVWDRGCA